jgi:hypothetical protein
MANGDDDRLSPYESLTAPQPENEVIKFLPPAALALISLSWPWGSLPARDGESGRLILRIVGESLQWDTSRR